MDENIMMGVFKPNCKIRFLSDPKPTEDYIAISASELIELVAAQMKLMALESGGVDNWEWYGESLHEYMKELLFWAQQIFPRNFMKSVRSCA